MIAVVMASPRAGTDIPSMEVSAHVDGSGASIVGGDHAAHMCLARRLPDNNESIE